MKKLGKVLFALAGACLFTVSCRSVFNAGLNGMVVQKDGSTVYPGVSVFVYENESERNADYLAWQTKSDWKDDDEFASNPNYYVMRTTTAANGEFTVSKIAWSTLKPKFGKDDDVHDVYLLFFDRDASSVTRGLYKYDAPVKIISGSQNSSSVKVKLVKDRLTYSGCAGSVRTKDKPSGETEASSWGYACDDGLDLSIQYLDYSTLTDKTSTAYQALATEKIGTNDSAWITMPKSSTTRTEGVEQVTGTGNNSTTFTSHGNFSGLGAASRLTMLYSEDKSSVGQIIIRVVWCDASGTPKFSLPYFVLYTDGTSDKNNNFAYKNLVDASGTPTTGAKSDWIAIN